MTSKRHEYIENESTEHLALNKATLPKEEEQNREIIEVSNVKLKDVPSWVILEIHRRKAILLEHELQVMLLFQETAHLRVNKLRELIHTSRIYIAEQRKAKEELLRIRNQLICNEEKERLERERRFKEKKYSLMAETSRLEKMQRAMRIETNDMNTKRCARRRRERRMYRAIHSPSALKFTKERKKLSRAYRNNTNTGKIATQIDVATGRECSFRVNDFQNLPTFDVSNVNHIKKFNSNHSTTFTAISINATSNNNSSPTLENEDNNFYGQNQVTFTRKRDKQINTEKIIDVYVPSRFRYKDWCSLSEGNEIDSAFNINNMQQREQREKEHEKHIAVSTSQEDHSTLKDCNTAEENGENNVLLEEAEHNSDANTNALHRLHAAEEKLESCSTSRAELEESFKLTMLQKTSRQIQEGENVTNSRKTSSLYCYDGIVEKLTHEEVKDKTKQLNECEQIQKLSLPQLLEAAAVMRRRCWSLEHLEKHLQEEQQHVNGCFTVQQSEENNIPVEQKCNKNLMKTANNTWTSDNIGHNRIDGETTHNFSQEPYKTLKQSVCIPSCTKRESNRKGFASNFIDEQSSLLSTCDIEKSNNTNNITSSSIALSDNTIQGNDTFCHEESNNYNINSFVSNS